MTHHVSRFTHHPTESQTRKALIDTALARAGWDIADPTQVGIEIPADDFSPQAWHALQNQLREASVPYDVKLPKGICDYVLYRPNGDVLAVVEAKRASVDARQANHLFQTLLHRAFQGEA